MYSNEIQEIIDKFILPTDFKSIPAHIQAGIRRCIHEASISGGIAALTPDTLTGVAKSIAKSAVAFEATLGDNVDKTRVISISHSWGWKYKSDTLQLEFRTYCQTHPSK